MRELTTNKTTASVFQTCEVYSDWHNFIHLSQFTINLVWESKQAKFHSSHFWQKKLLEQAGWPSFHWLNHFPTVQLFEKPEKCCRLSNPAELYAECLYLNKEFLNIYDLVSDERLK